MEGGEETEGAKTEEKSTNSVTAHSVMALFSTQNMNDKRMAT